VANRIDPLQIVLERSSCADPATGAFFFWDEVQDWPSGALELLVAGGLLQPSQPMATIECDGCEERCMMPVVVYPVQDDKPGRAFIVCDKPVDLGRIKVNFDRMRQWQTTGELIAAMLARLLGLSLPASRAADGKQWHIGTLKGKKHHSPVTLLAVDGLMLALAGHTVPLIEVLAIEGNALALDKTTLIRLADKPTGNSEAETREDRHKRLKARVGEEKAKGTKAFLKVVAEEEGFSVSRLKQLINDKPEPVNRWTALAGLSTPSSSKKTKPKY